MIRTNKFKFLSALLVSGIILLSNTIDTRADDIGLTGSSVSSNVVIGSGNYAYFKNTTGGDIYWTNLYENGNKEFESTTISNDRKIGVYNNGRGKAAVYYKYYPGAKALITTTVALSKWKFTDVAPLNDNWQYAPVKYVTSCKYMNGTGKQSFSPDVSTSRGMFATIIYNMAGYPQQTFTHPYPDIEDGKWYSIPISWAAFNHITSSDISKNFEPNKDITREESMKMLYDYAKFQGKDLTASGDLSAFADASSVSKESIDYIKWAVGHHIIIGKKIDGKLYIDPKGVATRVESAQLIKNYVDNMK